MIYYHPVNREFQMANLMQSQSKTNTLISFFLLPKKINDIDNNLYILLYPIQFYYIIESANVIQKLPKNISVEDP